MARKRAAAPKAKPKKKPAIAKPAKPAKAKSSRAERDRRYREAHRTERQKKQASQKRVRRKRERTIREQVHAGNVATGSLSDWNKAARLMREIARQQMGIDVAISIDLLSPGLPENGRGTPWAIRATLKFGTELDYSALNEVAEAWRTDKRLEKLIGQNRLTRMGVKYTGPIERGSRRLTTREWTASEIAPWDSCASRLVTQTSPDVPNSVALRYSSTTVSALSIWISHTEGNARSFR